MQRACLILTQSTRVFHSGHWVDRQVRDIVLKCMAQRLNILILEKQSNAWALFMALCHCERHAVIHTDDLVIVVMLSWTTRGLHACHNICTVLIPPPLATTVPTWLSPPSACGGACLGFACGRFRGKHCCRSTLVESPCRTPSPRGTTQQATALPTECPADESEDLYNSGGRSLSLSIAHPIAAAVHVPRHSLPGEELLGLRESQQLAHLSLEDVHRRFHQ